MGRKVIKTISIGIAVAVGVMACSLALIMTLAINAIR